MKYGFLCCSAVVATLVTAALVMAQAPAPAPDAAKAPKGGKGGRGGPAGPTGPAPHLPDGTPDFSGLWAGGGSNSGDITKGLKPGEQVVMLPSAEAIMKTRRSQDDSQANCLPMGVPRSAPYPWRMVQSPTHKAASHIFILYEGNIHSYRQIFMDGRKHPDDPDPTWYGHSIGHYEGETFSGGYGSAYERRKFWFDYLGHPHTGRLHDYRTSAKHANRSGEHDDRSYHYRSGSLCQAVHYSRTRSS